MRVNAASLDIRDATTSTPGTLNDLTTDLIMANNNNNNLLIHNFISPVHHIYKPFLNIYYQIIKVYRSGQFECNCITDLSLNIQPTISLHPLTLYRYGVDRPAHMLSMIDGFIVHIHGHVSRRPWYYPHWDTETYLTW